MLTSQRFDVGPGEQESPTVPFAAAYDIAVHGPNGFLREARGDGSTVGVEVAVVIAGSAAHPKLRVTFSKTGPGVTTARVTGLGGLGGPARTIGIATGGESVDVDPLAHDHGWYDIAVSLDGHPGYARRFAGHLENGRPSRTG